MLRYPHKQNFFSLSSNFICLSRLSCHKKNSIHLSLRLRFHFVTVSQYRSTVLTDSPRDPENQFFHLLVYKLRKSKKKKKKIGWWFNTETTSEFQTLYQLFLY